MYCHMDVLLFSFLLLLQSDSYTIPALFVYGHTATGKSLVINSLLKKLKVCIFSLSRFEGPQNFNHRAMILVCYSVTSVRTTRYRTLTLCNVFFEQTWRTI